MTSGPHRSSLVPTLAVLISWATVASTALAMVSFFPLNTFLFSTVAKEVSTCTNMALLDTAYLVTREQYDHYDWRETLPVARLQSAWSGIQVNVYSDQEAFQVYSCIGQNGT
jgi:hypothetical protein